MSFQFIDTAAGEGRQVFGGADHPDRNSIKRRAEPVHVALSQNLMYFNGILGTVVSLTARWPTRSPSPFPFGLPLRRG